MAEPTASAKASQTALNRGSQSNLNKNNSPSKNNIALGAEQKSRFSSLTNVATSQKQTEQIDITIPTTQAPQYENTYRTKPDKKFHSEPAKRIIDDILKNQLTNVKYDHEKTPDLVKSISDEISAAVKKLGFERYKFVVDVSIGEFKGQGIRVGSRCVWDPTTDTWASGYFRNATLFAVAMVFGLYYE